MEAHTAIGTQELTLAKAVHLDRNPAAVYLARLGAGSRRTMHQALDTIAELLAGIGGGALKLNWAALHYQHTQTVQTALAAWYSPIKEI